MLRLAIGAVLWMAMPGFDAVAAISSPMETDADEGVTGVDGQIGRAHV